MSKYEKKEKIENSIILSSMSYVEAQSLKEIEDNMNKSEPHSPT